jgi:hypothetical protein
MSAKVSTCCIRPLHRHAREGGHPVIREQMIGAQPCVSGRARTTGSPLSRGRQPRGGASHTTGALPLPIRTRVYPSSDESISGRSRKNPTSAGERVGVRGKRPLEGFVSPSPGLLADASNPTSPQRGEVEIAARALTAARCTGCGTRRLRLRRTRRDSPPAASPCERWGGMEGTGSKLRMTPTRRFAPTSAFQGQGWGGGSTLFDSQRPPPLTPPRKGEGNGEAVA